MSSVRITIAGVKETGPGTQSTALYLYAVAKANRWTVGEFGGNAASPWHSH